MHAVAPEEIEGLADIEEKAGEEAANHPRGIDRALWVAISSSFVLRLAGASTGLLLAAYLRQVVHAEVDLIGALAAVYYVAELLLAPVFGALSDLRGRKPFLVLGPIAGAIAVQVHPLTTIAAILAMGRLLEGVSGAANAPGTLGFLADSTSGTGPKNASLRGRVMGLYEVSFVVGLVGGQFAGGHLWDWLGANGFRLMSLVYLVAAGMLFFFVPETLPAKAREHQARTRLTAYQADHPVRSLLAARFKSYGELLREPALRSFVPAWLAINAVVGLWFTHIAPLMLTGTRHNFPNQMLDGRFSATDVGTVMAGFGVAFMLGILAWSQFYGRIRRTNMMLASISGLFITAAALFGINNNVLAGPWEQWPLLPVLVVGILLMSGFTPVALAYLADISESRVEHRGVVMGLYSVFLGVGQFIGGAGGGVFIRAMHMGFNGLLVGTVILAAVALVTVIWLRAKFKV